MSEQLEVGHILGLGSPLLDIIAHVDREFLRKYQMSPNDVIRPDARHETLRDDLIEWCRARKNGHSQTDQPDGFDSDSDSESDSQNRKRLRYIAGGSVQNVMRVAQWFFRVPQRVVSLGAIGADAYGEMMRQRVARDGLRPRFVVHREHETGTCVCLITGNGRDRSLCAFLGASQIFTTANLAAYEEDIAKAKIRYTSAFFTTVSVEAQLRLATYRADVDDNDDDDDDYNDRRLFAYNLSATFLARKCRDEMRQLWPYIDLLFGNADEAYAFAEANDWKTTNIEEIVQRLADYLPRPGNSPRTAIITQGGDGDILVAIGGDARESSSRLTRYPIQALPSERIVDTNGAGDAFVGGFLAYCALGKSLKQCVEAGIYAATEVIQMSGCSLPNENKFRV